MASLVQPLLPAPHPIRRRPIRMQIRQHRVCLAYAAYTSRGSASALVSRAIETLYLVSRFQKFTECVNVLAFSLRRKFNGINQDASVKATAFRIVKPTNDNRTSITLTALDLFQQHELRNPRPRCQLQSILRCEQKAGFCSKCS